MIEYIIVQSIYFIIPLLVVALAGLYSEKSGTVNIALEGIMLIGAFFGILFINIMQSRGILANSPQLLLFLAVLVAGVSGMVFSVLLGFLAIKMKADQTIGGTALNILGAALVIYLAKIIIGDTKVSFTRVFQFKSDFLHQIKFINYIFFDKAYLTTYIGIFIFIATVLIFKFTKFGLRLSACGEHPQAAQSAGVNVILYRWMGVLISGFLAGIGGLIYIIPTSTSFNGSVGGYGFLALAVLIFGQWKPVRVFLAATMFGVMKMLSVSFNHIGAITWLIDTFPNLHVDVILRMLPYLTTLIVLVISSKKSRAPKAAGIPFDPLST